MAADHHGGSRIRSAVQERKAQNVVVYVYHGVGAGERPHGASLQHEVDVRHAGPHPRAADAAAVVAELERRHGGGACDPGGGPGEGVPERRVDGGLEESVLIDCADLRAAVAVAVDGEERLVDRDGAVVDVDGFDLDKVFRRSLARRVRRRRADGVDEERRVGEGGRGVEWRRDADEVIRPVAEENDSVGARRRREAYRELPTEAECRREPRRHPNPGPAEARQTRRPARQSLEEECRGAREQKVRDRRNPARVGPVGGAGRDDVLG